VCNYQLGHGCGDKGKNCPAVWSGKTFEGKARKRHEEGNKVLDGATGLLREYHRVKRAHTKEEGRGVLNVFRKGCCSPQQNLKGKMPPACRGSRIGKREVEGHEEMTLTRRLRARGSKGPRTIRETKARWPEIGFREGPPHTNGKFCNFFCRCRGALLSRLQKSRYNGSPGKRATKSRSRIREP